MTRPVIHARLPGRLAGRLSGRLTGRLSGRLTGRLSGRLARAPLPDLLVPHRLGLAGVLLAGFALRGWLTLAYRPAFLGYPDSAAYVTAVNGPLFWNPYKPAGYPLMLRVLRALNGHLTSTIVVQHLLGLGAAALLYLAVAPFVRRRWLAVLPAAVVALSGTQLYLEHSVLSDGPFALCVAAALWCLARVLVPRAADSGDAAVTSVEGSGRRRALGRAELSYAAAGGFLALGTLLRPVGAVLLLIPGVMALSARSNRAPGWRGRAAALGCLLAGAALPLVPYLVAQHSQTGSWGLTRAGGEQFYGRVATFADCRRFTPPPSTRALCQSDDPARRPDANYYLFDPRSPLWRTFGTPGPSNPYDPDHAHYRYPAEGALTTFDERAILHQPGDFLLTTLEGLAGPFDPGAVPGRMLEWDTPTLVRELHDRTYETQAEQYVTRAYTTAGGFTRHDVGALDAYADAARIEGVPTLILFVLMLAGALLARGSPRRAVLLFGSATVLLAAAPVALLFYSVRYTTPAYGPLAAGAAVGIDVLWSRLAARAGRTAISSAVPG